MQFINHIFSSNDTVTNMSQSGGENKFTLLYGDTIQIISPSNEELHEMTFLITYIDLQKITAIHTSTGNLIELNSTEEGFFSDESIIGIHLIDRPEEVGFARIHNLLPKTWVDIHIGGEIPTIITAEIINLEEDEIEILTFPQLKTLYIDFAYRGLPLNIPISHIIPRNKPEAVQNISSLVDVQEKLNEDENITLEEINEQQQADMEFTPEGESIMNIPTDSAADPTFKDNLREMYLDANEIVFGEQLDTITQMVEVPESEKTYSIEAQVNDLMDQFLSTIPDNKRNDKVMSNIHRLILRFKELRTLYSEYDENHDIVGKKVNGPYHKPLVDKIHKLNTRLKWILPVVQNRKIIYSDEKDVEQESDVVYRNAANSVDQISEVLSEFHKSKTGGMENNYSDAYNKVDANMKVFDTPIDDSNCLDVKPVLQDLEAIVDNLGMFESSVANVSKSGKNVQSNLKRKKYLLQKYTTGSSQLERNVMKTGKSVYFRTPLTQNDTMCVSSIVTLPEPFIRMSAMYLPSQNILNRAELTQQYKFLFHILRTNLDIVPRVVNDLSKELDYDNEEGSNLFSSFNEFIINNDMEELDQDKESKFKKFLDVIIPKTRTILKFVRKNLHDKLSFVDVIKELEPYGIHSEDITYTQYVDIQYIVQQHIADLKSQMETKRGLYNALHKNRNSNVIKNPVSQIVNSNADILDAFTKVYFTMHQKDSFTISESEMISKLYMQDENQLYPRLISSRLTSLMAETNSSTLTDVLLGKDQKDMLDNDDYKIQSVDCTRKYLAKKYENLGDLQKDNNVDELYYDNEYDDTPYHIMDNYKSKKDELEPKAFKEFLIEVLIHKHDCPTDYAEELATILISKKKPVSEGEYAMLDILPEKQKSLELSQISEEDDQSIENTRKLIYYKRMKNTWIRDDSIATEAFYDTNTLFCNINETCFKNTRSNVCETNDESTIRFKQHNKKSILNEFDRRYHMTRELLIQELEKEITYLLKYNQNIQHLRRVQLYKANNLAVEIGNFAKKNELIVSPRLELLNRILGQTDFVTKQNNIMSFASQYTRNPLVEQLEEDQHWLYCKETNTKLLPITIFELAKAFVSGENYNEKLNQICNDYGREEGGDIVDKHSGVVLRKSDYQEEEMFDDSGSRITTHSLLEKELGDVYASTKGKAKSVPIFENETMSTIYNVLVTICERIHLPHEGIQDFVLRVSSSVIEKATISETEYKQKIEKLNKGREKKVKMPSYKNYKNENLILAVANSLIVAVQTQMPSFTSSKTFPGCVRSFTGYPLSGIEDTGAIQYIACVIFKIKSTIDPWSSLHGYKSVDKIVPRITKMMDERILKRPDVQEKLTDKREYLLLTPDVTIPNTHAITKWVHFLPPVVKYALDKSIQNVTPEFNKELNALIKSGNVKQNQFVNIVKSKNMYYGYHIIKIINDLVKDKELLLKTASSMPFIENTCCNSDLVNPVKYFIKEEPLLSTYFHSVKRNELLLKQVAGLSAAPFVYHKDFTGMIYPVVSSGNLEENIYSFIIKYCLYDRDVPVPEKYKAICSDKPEGYQKQWSLPEKIEFLKRNGKQYTENDFKALLNIVNEEHIVHIETTAPFDLVDGFQDILNFLEEKNSSIIPQNMRKLLFDVVDNVQPGKMYTEETAQVKSLAKHLTNVNKNAYNAINTYLSSKNEESKYKHVREFLENIDTWNIVDNNHNDNVQTFSQFVKNMVYHVTQVYPNVIRNGRGFHPYMDSNSGYKKWNLSDLHVKQLRDYHEEYYMHLRPFYENSIIIKLFTEMDDMFSDLNKFIRHLPVQEEVVKQTGDRTTTYYSFLNNKTTMLLMKYCFYTCMCIFIESTENTMVIQTNLNEYKGNVRKEKEEMSETLGNIITETNTTEENNDYVNALQNVDISDVTHDLKVKIAELIVAMLNIERDNKKVMNRSYADIEKGMRHERQDERQAMITYLGNMDPKQRRIEELSKIHKLGNWNVGNQDAIWKYDKKRFDNEMNEGEFFEFQNKTTSKEAEQEVVDLDDMIEEDQYMEDMEDGSAGYRDGTDFRELQSNYEDGDFYPEDRDPDDFYGED
uniref:Uncharacterized protein n=1 Tax=viral metagenome TaxID=1070528 RepID=A0A6C0IRY1_9ZZZZ